MKNETDMKTVPPITCTNIVPLTTFTISLNELPTIENVIFNFQDLKLKKSYVINVFGIILLSQSSLKPNSHDEI